MMTAAQYEKSLRNLNLVVYMFGERIINVVAERGYPNRCGI